MSSVQELHLKGLETELYQSKQKDQKEGRKFPSMRTINLQNQIEKIKGQLDIEKKSKMARISKIVDEIENIFKFSKISKLVAELEKMFKDLKSYRYLKQLGPENKALWKEYKVIKPELEWELIGELNDKPIKLHSKKPHVKERNMFTLHYEGKEIIRRNLEGVNEAIDALASGDESKIGEASKTIQEVYAVLKENNSELNRNIESYLTNFFSPNLKSEINWKTTSQIYSEGSNIYFKYYMSEQDLGDLLDKEINEGQDDKFNPSAETPEKLQRKLNSLLKNKNYTEDLIKIVEEYLQKHKIDISDYEIRIKTSFTTRGGKGEGLSGRALQQFREIGHGFLIQIHTKHPNKRERSLRNK